MTTGLQSNLRWDDASVGSWINEDLIGSEGDDASLCRYCGNDPVNATDPNGLVTRAGGFGRGRYGRGLRRDFENLDTAVAAAGAGAKKFIVDPYIGMARAGVGMAQEAGETIQAFMECPNGMAYMTIENFVLAVWNYDDTAKKMATGVCDVIKVMASDDNVAKSEIANRVLFGAIAGGAQSRAIGNLFKGVKQSRAELAAASKAGKAVPRKLATGAGYVDAPDPGAAARYSRIVDSLDDAAITRLAHHADVPEDVIRSVKAHMFEKVHPIQVAPGVVKPGRFTPMNEIADVWEAALRGEGREAFRNLLGHEYLESTLMKHCGLPFRPLADPSGMAVSAHNLSPSPWSGQFHPVQLQLWDEFLSQ